MIRKTPRGKYQVIDPKNRNVGTFTNRPAAEKRDWQKGGRADKELLPDAKKKLRPAAKKK